MRILHKFLKSFLTGLSRVGWLVAIMLVQGSAYAQESTATPISLFRDMDSLTLYAAGPGEASLVGFAYTVNDRSYLLESFSAFRGLPFDRLPTPICFRLVRSGVNSPLSLECPGGMTLVQTLTNADVFWYDSVAVQDFTLLIQSEGVTQGICASGQNRCDLTYTAAISGGTEATAEATVDGGGQDCTNDFNVPMTYIPQTTFFMGLSDDDFGESNERPGRSVTVGSFCMDTFEVTNARYASCVNEGFCQPPDPLDSETVTGYFESPIHARFPVINVTWEQAHAYCKYRGGSLPTEAEWELAARYDPESDEMRTFPWGNQTPDNTRANFVGRSIGDTVEVGQHPDGVSAFGIHDLSGNVAEWVGDWFGAYNRQNTSDPAGPEQGTARVVRGGSYADDAEHIRGGYRGSQSPSVARNTVGFRCVIPQK